MMPKTYSPIRLVLPEETSIEMVRPKISKNTAFNDIFMYSGNWKGLEAKLKELTPNDLANFREISIHCTGDEVKKYNKCCMIATACCGGILVLPLAFMFCNWWKKIVYPAFEIPDSTYTNLRPLLSSPKLETISISIVDNSLSKNKINLLYEVLLKARSVKSFSFVNGAGMYDYT